MLSCRRLLINLITAENYNSSEVDDRSRKQLNRSAKWTDLIIRDIITSSEDVSEYRYIVTMVWQKLFNNRILHKIIYNQRLLGGIGYRQREQRFSKSNLYFYITTFVLGISTSFVIWRKASATLCEAPKEEEIAEEKKTEPGDKDDVAASLQAAFSKSRDLIRRVKDEVGAPGIVVGVSIDGVKIWEEGFGMADVENRVPCSKDTVMRIASISKSITMTSLAKLWEDGKVDLDKPVQEYVPYFPQKLFNGEKVTITCRHLVSHLSGIRHYDKTHPSEKEEGKKDMNYKEFYLKDNFPNLQAAMDLFKNDPLMYKPGTKYLYTTHGWTLISAVVESIAKEPFTKHIAQMFIDMGMNNTFLDVNDKLIYHRSRFYCKDKKGHLINTPYVDNSYKWAGGGFLSTVGDLLTFGNIMLYSSQCLAEADGTSSKVKGYLKPETLRMVWNPVPNTVEEKRKDTAYGMGWEIVSRKQECGFCREMRHLVFHNGGAVGASSILFILPRMCDKDNSLLCQWKSRQKV